MQITPSRDDGWRQTHLGEVLRRALERFDQRVLNGMASDEALSLVLARLVARARLTASHVQITRHLPREGCTLTELARRARITKQAMGKLVDQCAAWGLVGRHADPRDARAVQIRFTEAGLVWLQVFEHAVKQAEDEFRESVGTDVATVTQLGLEVFAA